MPTGCKLHHASYGRISDDSWPTITSTYFLLPDNRSWNRVLPGRYALECDRVGVIVDVDQRQSVSRDKARAVEFGGIQPKTAIIAFGRNLSVHVTLRLPDFSGSTVRSTVNRSPGFTVTLFQASITGKTSK